MAEGFSKSFAMCKTVENSVDYAENPYFIIKIRHFSCISTKFLVENFFSKSGAASFLFFPYYNFYKTIDFSPKIGYNGVTKPQKEDKE